MEQLKLMWNSKSNVFRLLTVLLLLAGCITPLQAVEPIKQFTLRFEGKKQSDNTAVSLKQVTLSNLSRGCDTTFTSTSFQLQVLPEATSVETVDFVSSMYARLSSGNPFMAAAEVEVMLPSSAPLHLLLYGLDGKIQQRYDGEFETGTHRFLVEPSSSGVSFLTISDGQSQLTLKLIKLGESNAANISYSWSSESGQYDTRFWGEEAVMLRAATAKPFIYCEGDQLQLIGYADGFANSSLYDVPADNGDYTFLFDLPFYRIFGYEIARSLPSFVDVLFSVEDMNYKGVDNLASSDFIIKENGNSIGGTNESFAYIRKMNTIPYKIQTVLVLDNSYSLLPPDLAKMKAAAISLINNKEDNQEIAVYCFSGGVTLLQDFTTDPDLLVEAVNSIQEGANSTNLYGAFITGARKISEIFTTEQITQGFMVVFTDGNDTQNPPSMIDDAIAAREQKRVYMVGLGDLDATTLNRLANPGPYVPVTNTDELEQVFLSIQEDIVRYANSFYWLNFLSPKRDAGMVTLQVEIEQNLNTGANYYLEGSFNSNGFVDSRGGVFIDPYNKGNFLEGYDESYIFTNDETDSHILSAVTYYAENTPSYVWTSSDESVVQVKAVPQSFNKAELIFPAENNPGGVVTITVRDEANMDRSGNIYERTVQAQAFTVPKLTTQKITDITHTTAVSGGMITDNGGYDVTQKGIRYGISPEELNSQTNNGSGDSEFSGNLHDLQPGTTYYVQAYAQNKKGTGYGNVLIFETPAPVAPTVFTGEVTNITTTTARCTGTVGYNGGSSVTEQGICWSATTTTPTISDNKTIGDDAVLSDLSPNTTYYIRAYAVNDAGPGYGETKTFTTEKTPVVITFAGSNEKGHVDGNVADAKFNSPQGMTTDASGNLYVADTGNGCIRKIDPQGEVTTLPGVFKNPCDVAVDASGNIYVADSHIYGIYKIDTQGEVTIVPNSGLYLANPPGLDVDASGNVYAVGIANGGNKIVRISPEGVFTNIMNSGSYKDVAVDGAGNVYAISVGSLDASHHCILKRNLEGEVTTLAGSRKGYIDGNGADAKFNIPTDLALDNLGNVYVADRFNNRIRKINSQGEVTTLAGSTEGYTDGNGADARFYLPHGIAADSFGNLYVADTSNNCIRKITFE